jgi:hypothetical protein
MSEPTYKPHYFDLVMRSVSEGVVNQEVVLVREYANTPGELTVKQMTFTKDAGVPLVQAVIDAMDKQSAPIQELGLKELEQSLDAFAGGASKPGKGRSEAQDSFEEALIR